MQWHDLGMLLRNLELLQAESWLTNSAITVLDVNFYIFLFVYTLSIWIEFILFTCLIFKFISLDLGHHVYMLLNRI